jgi:hypothetical protein
MDLAKIEAEAAELEKLAAEVEPTAERAIELLKKVAPAVSLALGVLNKLKALHLP